jgi:hypothetical protein
MMQRPRQHDVSRGSCGCQALACVQRDEHIGYPAAARMEEDPSCRHAATPVAVDVYPRWPMSESHFLKDWFDN